MIPPVCYSAAVPLAIYGVLLGLNVIDRTDTSVVVLMFAEAAAVGLTVWGTLRRYVPRRARRRAAAPRVVADRRGTGRVYDEEHHPRQRASDRGWRYWGGWFYRHAVPAGAIVVAAIAVNAASNASDQAEQTAREAQATATRARANSAANRRALVAIQEGRRAAIGESCRQDERLADVVRKALLGFGVGRPGNPAPRAVAEAFRPLGGLKPLTAKERGERCADRIRRGGP